MKIVKNIHKDLLASCFFVNGVAREVSEDQRNDVKSLWDKLAEIQDNKLVIKDGEIELTPSEIVIAKTFYDAKKNIWPWNIPAETLQELKDIFYPPQNG